MASWPDVAIAAIAAVSATVSAFFSYLASTRTKMPNGTKMGEAVQATHDLAKANADRIEHVDNGVAAVVDAVAPEHASP